MSSFTKYLKNPVVIFLAGAAVGAASTYYYNQRTTKEKNETDSTNEPNKGRDGHVQSGKLIIV